MIIPPPSKVAASSPVTLPEELIYEVLSYLKVKTLIRMKCVNKSWNTLISDPIFIKVHLMRSPRNKHLLVMSSCSANIFPIPVSHFLKRRKKTIKLTDDPCRRFQSSDLHGIVGSCNGLICLLDCNYINSYYVDHSLYFWNPATRTKSEKLGSIRDNRRPYYLQFKKFTFGYDNSTDTYKVVLLKLTNDDNLVKTEVKVFTLGDNVWRDINCFPVVLVFYPDCLFQHDGVYFSNSINWSVCHQYNCNNLMIKEYVIVSLDLGKETYSQLLLPRHCNENPFDTTPTLFVFMDCLCFSYDFEKTHFVIWQMKEFGVEESWTQLLKISYRDLSYRDLNIALKVHHYNMRLIPLGFSADDALIFVTNFGYDPILYDWRNNRVMRTKCTNFEDKMIKYYWYDAKEYNVESLVSTC